MIDIPYVPVPWGDLIDKITILEIKVVRLPAQAARENAAKELVLLMAVAAPIFAISELAHLIKRLKVLNEGLWETENCLREHERESNFDLSFISLARSVYQRNDERGTIKREISIKLKSELVEEKSYTPY